MDGNDSAFAPHIEPLAQAGAAPAEVVVAQTAQGTVIALDAASGGPLWRWVTHDPRASIARAGERIFVISALSDRPIWVELDPPPRLPEGIVGRHANAVSLTHTRTRPAAVTALRASDGAVLWRVPFYCSAISPSASAGISVADDTLLTTALSFERGVSELLALDCATGAPRWSYSIGPLPLATTSVQPMVIWAEMGKVAVLTLVGPHEETRFVTLDAMTGAVLWQGEQAPQHDEAVQENETSGIRFTTDYALKWPHHILRATRIDSGADVWQMALDDLSGARSVETSVLAADGRLHLFWRRRQDSPAHCARNDGARPLALAQPDVALRALSRAAGDLARPAGSADAQLAAACRRCAAFSLAASHPTGRRLLCDGGQWAALSGHAAWRIRDQCAQWTLALARAVFHRGEVAACGGTMTWCDEMSLGRA